MFNLKLITVAISCLIANLVLGAEEYKVDLNGYFIAISGNVKIEINKEGQPVKIDYTNIQLKEVKYESLPSPIPQNIKNKIERKHFPKAWSLILPTKEAKIKQAKIKYSDKELIKNWENIFNEHVTYPLVLFTFFSLVPEFETQNKELIHKKIDWDILGMPFLKKMDISGDKRYLYTVEKKDEHQLLSYNSQVETKRVHQSYNKKLLLNKERTVINAFDRVFAGEIGKPQKLELTFTGKNLNKN